MLAWIDSTMTGKRKATDVLIELERKVDNLTKYVQSIDVNIKLVMNRLNGVGDSKPPAKTQPIVKRQEPIVQPGPTSCSTAPQTPGKAETGPTVESFIQVADNGKKQVVKPNAVETFGKKSLVHQKVVYADSKNVILAKVEIFDDNGGLMGTSQTNMTGKWNVSLKPGKYLVHICKPGTSNRPQVDQKFSMDVIASDTPIELDTLRIG